jgi:hypothetical protein
VAYRNSADFTIGLSPDGKPAVGYLYGRYTDGFTAVADPRNLSNISPVSKCYAELLTSFLRSESSKLPVWNKADNNAEVNFCELACPGMTVVNPDNIDSQAITPK